MDRRIALASLAALAMTPTLGASAFAQTSAQPDADHIKRTMTAGAASLASSRIAVQKARHQMVKAFAQFEVAEQETIADILKGMQEPSTTASAVKAPSDAEVQAQLDAKGKQLVQKLEAASSGKFDAEYVAGQIEGHQELLAIQEAFLSKGGPREEVNVAKLARGQIKEHLALLDMIQKQVKTG